MRDAYIPSLEIQPATRKTYQRSLARGCHIPTQAERKRARETFGFRAGAVYENWQDVDQRYGDLLYIGRATQLTTRLHPQSHAMWSVVWRHPLRSRIRIAVWGVPVEYLASVESWLTSTCRPLWSSVAHESKTTWLWRDPDCILPITAFHPHKRKQAPFLQTTPGVYAWLLAPETMQDAAWIYSICIDGATCRADVLARPKSPPPEPWLCRACGAFNHPRSGRCRSCQRTPREGAQEGLRRMQTALGYAATTRG
jgi:hypothetical protein